MGFQSESITDYFFNNDLILLLMQSKTNGGIQHSTAQNTDSLQAFIYFFYFSSTRENRETV